MFYINQGMVERAIHTFETHFSELDFNNKKIKECIEECRTVCPKLHSENELREHASKLLSSLEEKFGYLGLRVCYEVTHTVFGDDMLTMKYDKLLEDMNDFYNNYLLENDLFLKLDVYLLRIYSKEFYRKEYGVISSEECLNLYSLVNTVRLMNYDTNILNSLLDNIKFELNLVGGYYYLNKSLDNPDVIKELYIHLAESVGDSDIFKGHELFYNYDGYGNIVFEMF